MSASLLILTAFNAVYKDVADITLPAMARLARAQNYRFVVLDDATCDRRGGWIKIQPIIKALSSGAEYVLWLDIDALVVRTDLDIRDETHPSIDLYICLHHPAPPTTDPPHFNTGVMLIRASQWSREFFESVWARGPLDHRWNDQATIHHLLGYGEILGPEEERGADQRRASVCELDTAWNSIPGVCESVNPVIWHFAGMPISERIRRMGALVPPNDLASSKGQGRSW